MKELKKIKELANQICEAPAQNVNMVNQLVPGILAIIEESIDVSQRESVLEILIQLIEGFSSANILGETNFG